MKQCAIEADTAKNTTGRTIALFPGAFRPPHRAHFETVRNLASRKDIDEVVVIITNRCRHVPGKTKALDTDVTEKIWSIYLQHIPDVRVEVAPNSAVKHAISYFERVNNDDALIFCAGESELKQGSGRFSKINILSRQYGILATVIPSPVGSLQGGATAVRKHLADGNLGRKAFMAALPTHLSLAQCQEIWMICCRGLKDMHDIARDKIQMIIERQGIGEIENISSAKSDKNDQVQKVQLKSGNRLFVKFANDTVKAAKLGHPLSLKPRFRLYAERRALKWLATHSPCNINLPEVICFDNKTKTLILSELYPGGRFLEYDLQRGIFDPVIAWKVSEFLAHCHQPAFQVPAFWGDKEADLQHWDKLLHLRTTGIKSDNFPAHIRQNLETLQFASAKAAKPGFFHLDYCPKNIRLTGYEIGVIDFELCSSIGDPACDFGFLFGHYLFWGIVTSASTACQQVLHTAVTSYRELIGDLWSDMSPRIVAFSGAALIHTLDRNKQFGSMEQQILNIAARLLDQKLNSGAEIFSIVYKAFSDQSIR